LPLWFIVIASTWRALLLGARWLIIASSLLAVVIWLALAYQYRVVTDTISEALLDELRIETEVVAALVIDEVGLQRLSQTNITPQRRITIIRADGTAIYDSLGDIAKMDNHNQRPEIIAARATGSGISRRHSDSVGVDLLYAAKLLPNGNVARVAAPLTIEVNLEKRLLQPMAIAAVLVIVVAGMIMLLHVWRDRTRVQELVSVARAYAHGQFTRRAGLLGHDTMAHLGHELNAMGEQLQTNQQHIAQQQSLLDGALGALTEGVACVDAVDHILYANAAFRHLAASGTDVVGSIYYQHLPVQHLGQAQEFEHHRRQLRGLVIPVTGAIRVIVLHDITERKHLENARRDFISSVSHELKTPLTSISGFAETLLDGVIEEDPVTTRDFVTRIARHSDRLAELVRDVLTISRLEQGSWDVRPTKIEVAAIAQGVLDDHAELARRHHVTTKRSGDAQVMVISDPELLRQLLGNLVSNAIRYNRESGSVVLTIIDRAPDLDPSYFKITVEDTGIGIPPEHRAHIFERFYRVDSHRSRQTGGTGLGLAIIKQLLDAMGGSVSLVSSNSGSCFTLLLPRKDPRSDIHT
jgi:two-component system, OmpR family, phosphate regulon sensor histidine kinase PhoR